MVRSHPGPPKFRSACLLRACRGQLDDRGPRESAKDAAAASRRSATASRSSPKRCGVDVERDRRGRVSQGALNALHGAPAHIGERGRGVAQAVRRKAVQADRGGRSVEESRRQLLFRSTPPRGDGNTKSSAPLARQLSASRSRRNRGHRHRPLGGSWCHRTRLAVHLGHRLADPQPPPHRVDVVPRSAAASPKRNPQ